MDSVSGPIEVKNETFMHCQSTSDLGNLFLRIVMITEMIVGLPINIVALWIFCFRVEVWKPHTLFLLNLLLADFLLLISVPFRIDAILRENYWVFGQVFCRINLFMLAVSRSASIAFMTAVALYRYFKVVHPHHCISHITLTQSCWLAGLTWTVVIALRIPLVTTNLLYQDGNVSLCRSFSSYSVIPWGVKVHYVAFVAEFFLPWFMLLFCSVRIACYLHKRTMGRHKRVLRAIRAVEVICLVFTICFLPSILTGLGGVFIKHFHPKDCKSYNLITQLFIVSIGFTYLNSTLDPIIYTFASSVFRDAIGSFIQRLGFVKTNDRVAQPS
uniref:hydroxycarboxylic acid receptor 2 n=1 Tax=Scatophagus argus TaxID=75038 RepID=UPI001ED83E74|nr:hydroxycarboxylic acid receptor 2 [Scatophagus argus]XP_046258866.1 hydroxycarboxylic acid receptor 2 [Scatophagus argus]XP_046258867.1 hydroxycarboxylic acid receptor 2 [Scatophagus argus]XP_046258868.1 hydroxycarboxylic acid receptor 2 [Scatophagus argus]